MEVIMEESSIAEMMIAVIRYAPDDVTESRGTAYSAQHKWVFV